MRHKKKKPSEEQKEKRILWLSFYAGLGFAVTEFIFAIFSGSQSALMDAVYDASELIFIVFILFLTPLFHKPINEKHPYGYFQIESIILIIKGFMMLSVTFSVSADVIGKALSGGNHVNVNQVSAFQAILGTGSLLIYVLMRRMNRNLFSPTVNAELLGWKLDIFYSFGMSAAFLASSFLEKTQAAFLCPYFDPIMAVLVAAFVLPENIRMLWNAIKELFLFSPDDETTETVKSLSTEVLKEYDYLPVFFDIIKTGRCMWVSVYFETKEDSLSIRQLKEASDRLSRTLEQSFENCICELIAARGTQEIPEELSE